MALTHTRVTFEAKRDLVDRISDIEEEAIPQQDWEMAIMDYALAAVVAAEA